MARALVYAATLPRPDWVEFARTTIVGACALALILAGNALPL